MLEYFSIVFPKIQTTLESNPFSLKYFQLKIGGPRDLGAPAHFE